MTSIHISASSGTISGDFYLVEYPSEVQDALNNQTGTAYTLALSDAEATVEMENASANTLTIPAEASVDFPVGTRIWVNQTGAGTTTIAADTGVTLNGTSAGSGDISAQWGGVLLYKRASDEWVVSGDIGTVS